MILALATPGLPTGTGQARQRPPAQGHAQWTVERVDGMSASTSVSASYPLSLLVPRARDLACWAYLASHGGGMVSGDQVMITVRVAPEACAYLGSQSTGKVYRALHDEWSGQDVQLTVGPGGLLVYAPDAVSCFAAARYRQTLRYALAPGASLVACDGLLAGREARGEFWSFDQVASSTCITLDGIPAAIDRISMLGPRLARSMAGWGAFLSIVAIGPATAPLVEAARALLPATTPGAPFLASLAPCAGGHLLRIAAPGQAELTALCQRLFAPLADRLGGQPWLRRP